MQTTQIQNSLKKATIEMILLKLLSESDMYGYQLCQEIKKRSSDQYTILEGSMYPILYRLSEEGYIVPYNKKVGKRQIRVYYHMESIGTDYLNNLIEHYTKFTDVISILLNSKEAVSTDGRDD